jgi:hypothetical protein
MKLIYESVFTKETMFYERTYDTDIALYKTEQYWFIVGKQISLAADNVYQF